MRGGTAGTLLTLLLKYLPAQLMSRTFTIYRQIYFHMSVNKILVPIPLLHEPNVQQGPRPIPIQNAHIQHPMSKFINQEKEAHGSQVVLNWALVIHSFQKFISRSSEDERGPFVAYLETFPLPIASVSIKTRK